MAQRLTTIRTQLAKLQKQAEQLERAASKRIKAAAKVIARYKLSASDLTEALKLSGGGRASGRTGSRRSPLAGKSVPVKYRDSSGNIWSGRGRPPLWLVAAEKAGKKRDSFLIGSKKPARAKTRVKKAAKKVKAKRSAKAATGHTQASKPASTT
jgi:DNA-binding protein H-NS